MTAVKVVDASALAAILFQESGWEQVAQRLRGALLAAPTLLPYEILNIAWKKIRRDPDLQNKYTSALLALDDFNFTYHAVDTAQILPIALACKLTGYDASYLRLARALGAELVTLDQQLAAAAMARS